MAKTKLPVIFEPTHRHIRVKFNGEIIADSKNVMLLRDVGHSIHYMFPESDVKTEYLTTTEHIEASKFKGDKHHWTVTVGDEIGENSAWAYPATKEGRPNMEGYIGFNWDDMEAWYEEDEEVFIHARDPYHRVDTVRSKRHIRVEVDGVTVADSTKAVFLFETGLPTRYYIPLEDINMDYLEATDLETGCPYKGFASYWTINVNGKAYDNHVWGYKAPYNEVLKIENTASFYNEKLDIYVDGELEEKPRTVFG